MKVLPHDPTFMDENKVTHVRVAQICIFVSDDGVGRALGRSLVLLDLSKAVYTSCLVIIVTVQNLYTSGDTSSSV